MARFSEREGYAPPEAEITVRHDAPTELRGVVADIAYECGLGPHVLRSVVCRTLRRREDPNNWSPFPNVDGEVRGHLDSCEWYEVYDVIEAIHTRLQTVPTEQSDVDYCANFEAEIDKYFRRRGIGWQMKGGAIEARGSEVFEHTLDEARRELADSNRATAAKELHEAIHDLSRRPNADVTGAIQHALAALECVARDVVGDPKATLGTILARNSGLLPAPLDTALEKLWGFASEQGRHLREGREPSYEIAELLVQVAAAVSRYLSKVAPP